MALTDSKQSYGWISILLHWSVAIAVVAMFLIGEQFEDLPRGDARAFWMGLHISVGVLVLPLALVRVINRLLQGKPKSLPQPKALEILSLIVHYGLLLAIVVLFVSGPLTVLSNGRPLKVFDWFAIPSPFARDRDLHELAETVHVTTVKVLVPLFWLHVLGVAKHLIFDRDKTLLRMLRPERT